MLAFLSQENLKRTPRIPQFLIHEKYPVFTGLAHKIPFPSHNAFPDSSSQKCDLPSFLLPPSPDYANSKGPRPPLFFGFFGIRGCGWGRGTHTGHQHQFVGGVFWIEVPLPYYNCTTLWDRKGNFLPERRVGEGDGKLHSSFSLPPPLKKRKRARERAAQCTTNCSLKGPWRGLQRRRKHNSRGGTRRQSWFVRLLPALPLSLSLGNENQHLTLSQFLGAHFPPRARVPFGIAVSSRCWWILSRNCGRKGALKAVRRKKREGFFAYLVYKEEGEENSFIFRASLLFFLSIPFS